MQANYVQRLRIIFSKLGPTRYISHLDLARALERSLNRAKMPLSYTQGYNRRPRMQLAAALPLGFTSEYEIADIWMLESINPKIALAKIKPMMAPGIEVQRVAEVDLKGPPLQTLTSEATYQAAFIDSPEISVLEKRVIGLLVREEIWRQRKGKEYDLRPLILNLSIEKRMDGSPGLKMDLSLLPGKTGRPDEVIAALDLDPLSARIHRTKIVLANDINQVDEN